MSREEVLELSLAALRFFRDSDIRDPFMREKCRDYFENSRHAVVIQREHARRNPREFAGYDDDCWALAACDGPGSDMPDVIGEHRRLLGYAARGVRYGPDDGTLAGWAALASLPFAPEIVVPTVRTMYRRYPGMRPINGMRAVS